MKRLTIYIVAFIVTAMLTGCHKKQPEGLLSKGKMEKVLYDYHLALAAAQLSADSTEYRSHLYTEAALRKHGVTKAELDSSLVWYAANTRELYDIYKNIEIRMDKEMQLVGNAGSQTDYFSTLSQDGDTANVWSGRRFYVLSPNGLNNRMAFTIEADSNYLPEDTYLWHFTTHFVYREGARNAVVSLMVRYANDSVQTVMGRVSRDGEFQIQLTADDKEIKNVEGFVYLDASWSKEQKLLFISQPSLVRYHKQKPIEESVVDTMANVADTMAAVADTTVNVVHTTAKEAKPVDATPDNVKQEPDTASSDAMRKFFMNGNRPFQKKHGNTSRTPSSKK